MVGNDLPHVRLLCWRRVRIAGGIERRGSLDSRNDRTNELAVAKEDDSSGFREMPTTQVDRLTFERELPGQMIHKFKHAGHNKPDVLSQICRNNSFPAAQCARPS